MVGFHKKSSGNPSVTYPKAVDEALCFGWIDGVRKSVNTDSYRVRFTPRKPKSQWSAVNIRRARQLVDSGRMQAAGLKAFEGAAAQSRAYSYEQRSAAQFSGAEDREFRANQKAWAFFQAQPPWYRRISTFWVISAKQEETRQRRLATLIADSGQGKTIAPLTRKSVRRKSRVPKR